MSASNPRRIFEEKNFVKIIRRRRITIKQRESVVVKENDKAIEVCQVCHSRIRQNAFLLNENHEIDAKETAEISDYIKQIEK